MRAPASVDFGDQQVGTAKVKDLVVTNDGPGILVVGRLSIASGGSTAFTFSPSQVAAPVAPALGSARAVVADYFADGQLNGAYSVDELRAALVFAQRHQSRSAQYSAFSM